MPTRKKLGKYPTCYWTWFRRAYYSQIILPCHTQTAAENLRKALYNFRLALIDECDEDRFIRMTQKITLTVKQGNVYLNPPLHEHTMKLGDANNAESINPNA